FDSPSAWSWGTEGHLYINQIAAEKLPPEMPAFFRSAARELAYLGPEPDRWRDDPDPALKSAQEPDHYIDLERLDWLAVFPKTRYEFYQKLYEKRAQTAENGDLYLPERVGLQPYIVVEVFDRLRESFREYRRLEEHHEPTSFVEHKLVFYAGWLGHYVADGSQPLHTTIHYNGWVGANPHGYRTRGGIHSEFESAYLSRNITDRDFRALVHAPERINDPFASYLSYLRDSNQLVERVYQLELAGGFRERGSKEAFDFTIHRLAAASQMLVDLWYTAWLESGYSAGTTR
ncbi:MAG: nuclease, partial [Acidobacteria bacterium]|nr:nuclease [Acidobacteriota bacterium]